MYTAKFLRCGSFNVEAESNRQLNFRDLADFLIIKGKVNFFNVSCTVEWKNQ